MTCEEVDNKENSSTLEVRPFTFIQWKGTDLCADFYCLCGDQFHFDGEFCYAIQCPHCERKYHVGTRVALTEITDSPEILKIGFGDNDKQVGE